MKTQVELKLHQPIADITQIGVFTGSVTHPWESFLRLVIFTQDLVTSSSQDHQAGGMHTGSQVSEGEVQLSA